MSSNIVSASVNLRRKVKTFSDKLKIASDNYLQSPSDIEYLFISIYRAKFKQADRKILMRDILYHIDNPDRLLTEIELIGRYSTLYNNRILGLEVQNASVYGSKIELSFDDFDRKLANKIRKHDIVIIHRINKNKLKMIDAIASLIGLSTYFPSGINEGASFIGNNIKDKLTDPLINKVTSIADQFLEDEPPIFSGLITLPQSEAGNLIKLTIEGQDMVRIMQHINTEERNNSQISGIPEDIDLFISRLVGENGINVRGNDHVNILTSTFLKTLSQAVYEEIVSFDNVADLLASGVEFRIDNISLLSGQLEDFNNKIFIRSVTNGMHLIHISPLKAIKLFVKYYAKNTGINTFFDFDTWDTDFFEDRSIVEGIYKNIYKGLSEKNPFISFGLLLKLPTNDIDIIPYHNDQINNNVEKFKLFKNYDIAHVFTERTFDDVFKHRVLESLLLKFFNSGKSNMNGNEVIIAEFFAHLVKIESVPSLSTSIKQLLEAKVRGGKDLFLSYEVDADTDSYIISSTARQNYLDSIEELRDDFNSTLSINFIIATNFSSVRSVEYNPVLTNQMKSIPITQIIQLLIGSMTSIPISQKTSFSSSESFDNTAHNISQRIWLRSAIGFKNLNTGDQSWVFKKGMIPVIFFGLRYKPSLEDDEPGKNITYMSDKDTINSKMFTLPSTGSLSIYDWGTEHIHIGYSRLNGGDLDDVESAPQLSLGGTAVFNLNDIAGDINMFVSTNNDKQVGGVSSINLQSIPRLALFKIEQTAEGGVGENLEPYDTFVELDSTEASSRWIYLGYDLYAMTNAPQKIKLSATSHVKLFTPVIRNGVAGIENAGVGIWNTNEPNVKPTWNNSEGDFPDEKKAKIGEDNDGGKGIVTGIKDYYDPTQFLSTLKSYIHFINLGFTGVNGSGDNNLYDDKKLFQVFHNIEVDHEDERYLDTFRLTDDVSITANESSVKELIEFLIEWMDQYTGNIENKRTMMLKFARNITLLPTLTMNGDEGAFERNSKDSTFDFHPPTLMSSLQPYTLVNEKAIKTMNILVGVVRSLSHYMNRFAKESTTGGVLYCPFKNRKDGTIFDIGDAISFRKVNDEGVEVISKLEKLVTSLAIVDNNPQTNLDIYKKIYYIWKITYYFGGAGTDPSGSSGSTMRIYLTDSGIHWQSSYEERDITTRIAETMQLSRLAVKL